jgi:hypothetical protein
MMKTLCVALLLLVTSVAAFGQENEGDGHASGASSPPSARVNALRDEAARLLKSDAAAERAWGAYLVGAHGLKGQAASLVELLTDTALGYGPEENLVRQAALDSLIRLDAKAPADALRPLYQSFPNEVVILMSRAPEEGREALLGFFAAPAPGARWLAVGNLLSEVKARGFAAVLLREMRVEVNVVVLDVERDINYGGGGGGGGCGYGEEPTPAGFPPVGFYALTDEDMRGATVFAPGRRPAYYVRRPFQGHCIYTTLDGWEGRDTQRLEYVAELLGTTTDDLGFDVRSWRTVVCRDARGCRRGLAALRREVEQAHAGLVARLVAENHLDAAEATGLQPDITFHLLDERNDKSSRLPETLKGVKLSVE